MQVLIEVVGAIAVFAIFYMGIVKAYDLFRNKTGGRKSGSKKAQD